MTLLAFTHARIVTRPALFTAVFAAMLLGTSGPVAASHTEVHEVVSIAKDQIGDPWVWGKTGPNQFDCVGFVWFSFDRAGLDGRIGGYRRVRSYRQCFTARGRASRYDGRLGDLVIWGKNKHIGIYLGNGRTISALVDGVRIHSIHQLTDPFLHFRIERG